MLLRLNIKSTEGPEMLMKWLIWKLIWLPRFLRCSRIMLNTNDALFSKVNSTLVSGHIVQYKPNFCGKKNWIKLKRSVFYAKFSQETENGTCEFLSVEEKSYNNFHIFIWMNIFVNKLTYNNQSMRFLNYWKEQNFNWIFTWPL